MEQEKYILPLGISLNFHEDDYFDQLKEAERLGVYSVDLTLCGLWNKPEEERAKHAFLEECLQALKNSKLVLNAVHISFGPNWNPSELDEVKRAENCARILDVIKRSDAYAPRCYVLHGAFGPLDPDRKARLDILKSTVLELAKNTKTIICLETQPRRGSLYCSTEACEVYDWFEKRTDNIRVCIDVNHILEEKSEDAVLQLGKRIFTTHISDHDYVDERHWLPGKGKIDWMKLLESFEKIGYHGIFNYETTGCSIAQVKENYEAMFGWYNQIRIKK